MRRIVLVAAAGSVLMLGAGALGAQSSELLQSRLQAQLAGETGNGPRSRLIHEFYARRGGSPAWVTSIGALEAARELDAVLEHADREGLSPGDYPRSRLGRLLSMPPNPDSLALIDFICTDLFLRYGAEVALGRVAPHRVDTMWTATPQRLDLLAHLSMAVDSGRTGQVLADLSPPQPGAARLRAALARYREIAAQGGWLPLPAGPSLALGDTGSRVLRLRHRLEISGEVAPGSLEPATFDSTLDRAVRRLEARHGLAEDGIAGPQVKAALNVSVEGRIRQLELNLERWRWLPRELGAHYVVVNSAAFTLQVIDSGRVQMSTPIVTGRRDWQTPIVSGVVSAVTFNPSWNIPRSIAQREILPLIRRDSTYLRREGIHVLSDTTESAAELNPAAIDWIDLSDSAFGYRLRQDPGPSNPLGRIRLTVANRFGVALHDTPDRQLFGERTRTFSHGCVRVGDAEGLARFALRGRPGWSDDSTLAALALPMERRVAVQDSLPVYFVYWTAWVDEDGAVAFRPDVYHWDAKLSEALRRSRRR